MAYGTAIDGSPVTIDGPEPRFGGSIGVTIDQRELTSCLVGTADLMIAAAETSDNYRDVSVERYGALGGDVTVGSALMRRVVLGYVEYVLVNYLMWEGERFSFLLHDVYKDSPFMLERLRDLRIDEDATGLRVFTP